PNHGRTYFSERKARCALAGRPQVTVEHHWLVGQFDRLPALMADLMRRRVAVIKPGSNFVALAANAATRAIPIVFGVGEDPVKLGLVASLARPGGNLTGINFFGIELNAKPLASARVGARGRLHCRAGQSGQYPGFRKRATGS